MSEERRRSEKDEKEEEKEQEKQEKSWEEKWRRDPLNVVTWALVIAWGGVVLILDNQGIGARVWGAGHGWAAFFAGAGALLLLNAFIRLVSPAYRRRITGGAILGVVFLGIGLGGIIGWGSWIWGAVLIVIAALILLGGFGRRRPRA